MDAAPVRRRVRVNVCRVTAQSIAAERLLAGDLRRHATGVRKVSLRRYTSSRLDAEPVLPKAEDARRKDRYEW